MGALTAWHNPQLSGLHDEIDELFDRFFRTGTGSSRGAVSAVPAVESFVRDDQLVVRADLPGIDPKAVDVMVEGDRLWVRGERRSEHEDAERHYREVSYGRFERAVALPPGIDPETVHATYRDGVLEVTMAKPATLVTRKVPIAVQ